MLDVAACAELLIEGHTAFSKLSTSQRKALVILVALHDVGKLSESFRDLVIKNKRGAPLHWQLSDFLLCGSLDEILSDLGRSHSVRTELYAAVAGHHGKPPDRSSGNRIERIKRKRAIGSAQSVARTWVTNLLALFPNASLNGISETEAKTLSWVLSGLTVAADWLGSNPAWFPIETGDQDFNLVLEQSMKRAHEAIKESGIVPPLPSDQDCVEPLGLKKMRPMQNAALKLDLSDTPQLVVIEDSTGTGKTEAAMVLAHRMIEKGLGRGLFFALPTMATSNAMLDRVKQYAGKMFKAPPSVVLTHSRARFFREFRHVIGTDQDNTPEATSTSWLTDNRRRALLATIGVGTIDQVLLGVLPSKFSTLRLYGLSDKVLIVDEAHSYDPYMQEELKTLLTMHARLGGSAILMTATLPLGLRQEYVSAFQIGLDISECTMTNDHYPSVHLVSDEVKSVCVDPVSDSVRTININRCDGGEQALELLLTAATNGSACVWVRNAVDTAIEAVQILKSRGHEADLLHARFALCDRLEREREIMQYFGKKRGSNSGRILVATQVLEASLDLDFDVMISDLAPIGSLIQRAGRLWRHMEERPANVRPSPKPVLNVLSPDPNMVTDEKWLLRTLDQGAWIYRLDEQWRTARVLFDSDEIVAPEGLRALIEAVHGKDALSPPEVLANAHFDAEGEVLAEVGLARRNVVEVENGYLNGTRGAVGNDALFPTRLGIPQITLVLVKREGNQLVPWATSENSAMAWSLSEISVSRNKFKQLLPSQDSPEINRLKRDWPEWRRVECQIVVIEDDGSIGDQLVYDQYLGLQIKNSGARIRL